MREPLTGPQKIPLYLASYSFVRKRCLGLRSPLRLEDKAMQHFADGVTTSLKALPTTVKAISMLCFRVR